MLRDFDHNTLYQAFSSALNWLYRVAPNAEMPENNQSPQKYSTDLSVQIVSVIENTEI